MPDAGSIGMNYKFVLEGGEEGVTLCAVEELALNHFKENGYPEGMLTGKILNHQDTRSNCCYYPKIETMRFIV